MMDFFKINVVSRGKTNFEKAMMIGFNAWDDENLVKPQAEYYALLPDNTMILYSYNSSFIKCELKELPYKMNLNQAISFVWGFLENAKIKDPKPDIDGSIEPGWIDHQRDHAKKRLLPSNCIMDSCALLVRF
jgi:hypothetical protein